MNEEFQGRGMRALSAFGEKLCSAPRLVLAVALGLTLVAATQAVRLEVTNGRARGPGRGRPASFGHR